MEQELKTPDLINEIAATSIFSKNKNPEEFKRISNRIYSYLNPDTKFIGYYIHSEFSVLDTQEYLILYILTDKNIYEISFSTKKFRIDILPLKTVTRMEVNETETMQNEDGTIPPYIDAKIYHNIGAAPGVVRTEIYAEGNNISKLEKFVEKIRKKVFSY